MKIIHFFLFSLTSIFLCGQTDERPNIVVIMADDLGFSDLSCYGGEIPTPNLDRLAFNGLRFSRYYTSPMCVTSRVAFLSGMEYQAAGGDNLPHSVSIAELLRQSGYATSMAGKNHGADKLVIGQAATDLGFDHFFGFTGGELYSFSGAGNVRWQEDGRFFPNTELPPDFYTSDSFTDHAISYMQEAHHRKKPFFCFLSFNAPHTPLQAPERNVRKFYDPENGINLYRDGWEVWRKKRLERLKKLGILPRKTKLSPLGTEVPDWDLLPPEAEDQWVMQQSFEALTRSAFAGMVDNLDENVGRVIRFLEDPDQNGDASDSVLDNTLLLFISDNGGCYAGLHSRRGAQPWVRVDEPFTTNYGWGSLSNTPFRYYKHASHEGAIRSPMIIHWPRGIRLPPGTILHQMTRVWDLYPTFLELAGDKTARPELMGSSLTPLFHDSSHRTEEFFISTFHRSKGLIDGKWKIVTYHDSPWELYNLRKDPSETRDLAKRKTRLLNKMIRRWQDYAQTHGFADDPQWNRPPGNEKRGWGVDFKRKGLVAAYPEFMSRIAPGSDRKLSLEFAGPVDFSNTENKMIRLQRYGDERIIWSADPDEGHPSQGKSRITFEDFPVLEPDTHYYITWDAAWVKYWDGSKNVPIPPIRESAFAYRFKTNKASIPD